MEEGHWIEPDILKMKRGIHLVGGPQIKSVWITVDLIEAYSLHILQGIWLLLDLELLC